MNSHSMFIVISSFFWYKNMYSELLPDEQLLHLSDNWANYLKHWSTTRPPKIWEVYLGGVYPNMSKLDAPCSAWCSLIHLVWEGPTSRSQPAEFRTWSNARDVAFKNIFLHLIGDQSSSYLLETSSLILYLTFGAWRSLAEIVSRSVIQYGIQEALSFAVSLVVALWCFEDMFNGPCKVSVPRTISH